MSVSKAVRLRVSVGGELTVLQKKQRMFPLSVMRLSNDDAALRALVSHQCSGQIPTQCHTYVFSPYPEGCSPVFFPPEKTNFWKFHCEVDAHVISISWGSGIFRPSQTHLR